MQRYLVEPDTDQPMRNRVKPWRCGNCGDRIADLNWLLPTEQIHRHRCKTREGKVVETVNALVIVVVVQSPEAVWP